MKPALLPLLAFVIAVPRPAPAQDPAPEAEPQVYPLVQALVLPSVGRGGRRPVHQDALEAQVVAGTWSMPKAGDEVARPRGDKVQWKAMTAGDDGWLRDRALGGGYALMTFDSALPRVLLLVANGHSMVYVNGVPRAGDPYSKGFQRLPVRLEAGKNTFLFRVGRGQVRAQLVEPTSQAMLWMGDPTTPDVVVGENEPVLAGLNLINVTPLPQKTLKLVVTPAGGGDALTTEVPTIAPLTMRKVACRIPGNAAEPGELVYQVRLIEPIEGGQVIIHGESELKLNAVGADALHKRTFVSEIDGSVQYYAVRPALPDTAGPGTAGLVLTMHGANVPGRRQAACYQSRPGTYIVAPTNRREFGFDWEDWGRLDALEVLELARTRYRTDPRKTYATGHSMGGHGTWHMGAMFPDTFAAIGPSAGWRDFWSYGGAARYDGDGPVDDVLRRATQASNTLAMSRNYLHHGVYILHGDKDGSVDVEHARFMRKHLEPFHDNVAYHEQEGAGHWWGNQCMDWPPLMEFLEQHEIPRRGDVKRVEFVTPSPGVSPSCHWVTIEGQRKALETSSVDIALDAERRRFEGTTDNVSRLAIDLDGLPLAGTSPLAFALDGGSVDVRWPDDGIVRLQRDEHGAWRPTRPLDPRNKGPHRYGTFKDAFRNRMMFVYATGGDERENAWAYAKARFDAETFAYRGNGAVDLVPDGEFDASAEPDRNVVLYGNADTNRAWSKLLASSPVQVHRDRVVIAGKRHARTDLGVLMIRPRPGSDVASVGVVGGSGVVGCRVTERLPYFVSGVAYPDLLVVGADVLTDGESAIVATGFFGQDWSIPRGEIVAFDP